MLYKLRDCDCYTFFIYSTTAVCEFTEHKSTSSHLLTGLWDISEVRTNTDHRTNI